MPGKHRHSLVDDSVWKLIPREQFRGIQKHIPLNYFTCRIKKETWNILLVVFTSKTGEKYKLRNFLEGKIFLMLKEIVCMNMKEQIKVLGLGLMS